MQSKSPLLQVLRSNLRLQHMSRRTENAYVYWTKRFVRFSGLRHPAELGPVEVREFLSHLVEVRNLSAATQQQALSALLFLYRNVIGRPLESLGPMPRGRVPTTLPVVLTQEEVARVVKSLRGLYRLVGILLYGSGLRLTECLGLRVKDIDLGRGELIVRRGKGGKDRVTVIPAVARDPSGISWSGSGTCISGTWPRGLGGSSCRRAWTPSIPTRRLPGPGSGYFRPGAGIGIRRPVASCDTIFMSRRFSGP